MNAHALPARALIAEALGTGLLTIATLGGALVSAGQGGDLAGQPALSLTIGLALYVLITLTIPISGGHINPAVTLLFALRGAVTPAMALGYMLFQVFGALVGVISLHVLWGLDALQSGEAIRSGAGHWASEVLASAGLALVICLGLRAAPAQTPAMVGSFAVIAMWSLPSGGMQNPAVLVARIFTATPGGMRAEDLLPGLLAMAIGTLIGWALGRWLVQP